MEKAKEKNADAMNEPWRYVVYCFDGKEKVNLNDASKIVSITDNIYYKIPDSEQGRRTYVVTVLDRMQNESKGVKYKVKR